MRRRFWKSVRFCAAWVLPPPLRQSSLNINQPHNFKCRPPSPFRPYILNPKRKKNDSNNNHNKTVLKDGKSGRPGGGRQFICPQPCYTCYLTILDLGSLPERTLYIDRAMLSDLAGGILLYLLGFSFNIYISRQLLNELSVFHVHVRWSRLYVCFMYIT